MKAVMISIQPKWVEKIASGEKTIEVRKNNPKIATPFKCYIYCTKGNFHKQYSDSAQAWRENALGKVIGEFVCDKIFDICIEISKPDDLPGYPFPCTGLTDKEVLQYLGNGKTGYGWHISDLKIYDKPKKLSLYPRMCKHYDADSNSFCRGCEYFYEENNESAGYYSECLVDGLVPVKKPPQSWCYVEEFTDEKSKAAD